jgi:hypothetical protein
MATTTKKTAAEPTPLEKRDALYVELENLACHIDGLALEERQLREEQDCQHGPHTRSDLTPRKAETDLAQARVNMIRGKATQADIDRLVAARAAAEEAIRDLIERQRAAASARKAIYRDIDLLVKRNLPAFIDEARQKSAAAREALDALTANDAIAHARQLHSEARQAWTWLSREASGMSTRDEVSFDASIGAFPIDEGAVRGAILEPRAVRIAAEVDDLDQLGHERVRTYTRGNGQTIDVLIGSKEQLAIEQDPEWSRSLAPPRKDHEAFLFTSRRDR